MQCESYTYVGDLAGAFGNVLIVFALYLRISTPIKVRNNLGKFGASYSIQEPTDSIERKRLGNRYVCMRIQQCDFSTNALRETATTVFNAESAECQKIEVENDVGDGQLLFSKYSRCRFFYYCSRHCQKQHWKVHKNTCQKPAKSSLPEPLLNLKESIHQGHAKQEGGTIYPTLFGVWLSHVYVVS
mmetsp:Transcript_4433/g.7895  ORF Transcript_4433/g.7895 Transcript_4433/m.7895 type:complete len:186 (-) Transcript_4433:123-680(-)